MRLHESASIWPSTSSKSMRWMPLAAVVTNRALKRDKFLTWCSQLPGVSEFLCKRDGLQLTQIRSPNSMVNRFSAAFQSRIGMLHFWLMLRKAR